MNEKTKQAFIVANLIICIWLVVNRERFIRSFIIAADNY